MNIREKLQNIIEKHWYYKPNCYLALILKPISYVYQLIIYLRKIFYKISLKSQTKLPVPVIIIGNLTVGGVGKTPLTKSLAMQLTNNGFEVGIILRGYKGSNKMATLVTKESDSAIVGDEAIIYAQNGFKVAIGSSRVDAGKLLLNTYPQIQVILADDGMQHYALHRDFEICVIDGTRNFGNQSLLPDGPLREPINRLKSVDAIVINGILTLNLHNLLVNKNIYVQNLQFIGFYDPNKLRLYSLTELKNINKKPFMAMAAIGNPQRFFDYLTKLGINLTKIKSFPDHYHYKTNDIDLNYTIITTEKDYTKLAKFHSDNILIAQVNAELDQPYLIEQIIKLIKE